MKQINKQEPRALYSVRLPEGDMICNCPAFIVECLEAGYKVRLLRWVRQLWETGEIVTMETFKH